MVSRRDIGDDSDPDIDVQTPHYRFRAKAQWVLAVGAAISVCVLSVVGGIVWISTIPNETPDTAKHGWSAEAFEEEDTQQFISQLPPFQITDENGIPISQDNQNADVRLWDAVIAVNGQHLVNIPQQIGDCVSHAYCHAGEYLICVEMKTGPPGNEFHRLFRPYVYGISRVQIGGRKIRGDGSCVAWAVRGGKEYGVLRADAEGVPSYSGALARQWGKEGPPRDLIEATKMYSVGISSPTRTANEVRDAICNGYPVPFGASGIGFDRVIEKYGRLVGVRSGSWSHAQCVIGYDGSGEEPLFCIVNSWGPRAGGKSPIDGSPPGSYWITARDMEYIARQGDAFAISNFEGFKAREIDFRLTRKERKVDHATVALAL